MRIGYGICESGEVHRFGINDDDDDDDVNVTVTEAEQRRRIR